MWKEAIDKEISSLESKGTFSYVLEQQAKGKKILPTRWVLATKQAAPSSADSSSSPPDAVRYKARLVARGDKQRPGIDFHEVFASVVNASTLRIMLAIAAVEDMELEQMDVVTAFLNAPLEEELYLRVPEGFPSRPGHVVRLHKSLYGLRQAPRCWNKTLHDFFISKDLQQSQYDSSLYFIPNKLWVAVWVDDLLIMARNTATSTAFKAALSARFEMQDLGPVRRFLGLEVTRDRAARTISLTAMSNIDDVLVRFRMADAATSLTPMPEGDNLGAREEDEDELPPEYPYRALVGCLNYLVTWVRPDLSFPVLQLARNQQHPTMRHWLAAKHILRYLKHTRDLGLCYSAAPNNVTKQVAAAVDGNVVKATQLLCYVDASWAEDESRKSQTGYVFCYGNAAIAWSSRLQSIITLSSTEAEYVALGEAVKSAIYLRNLLREVCNMQNIPPVVFLEDNQGTIKQALNLHTSSRNKHIDIRYHFLKHHFADESQSFSVHYVPTSLQAADLLTKSVNRVKVEFLRQIILGG